MRDIKPPKYLRQVLITLQSRGYAAYLPHDAKLPAPGRRQVGGEVPQKFRERPQGRFGQGRKYAQGSGEFSECQKRSGEFG